MELLESQEFPADYFGFAHSTIQTFPLRHREILVATSQLIRSNASCQKQVQQPALLGATHADSGQYDTVASYFLPHSVFHFVKLKRRITSLK